jgi:hypothetical protein
VLALLALSEQRESKGLLFSPFLASQPLAFSIHQSLFTIHKSLSLSLQNGIHCKQNCFTKLFAIYNHKISDQRLVTSDQ